MKKRTGIKPKDSLVDRRYEVTDIIPCVCVSGNEAGGGRGFMPGNWLLNEKDCELSVYFPLRQPSLTNGLRSLILREH